MILKKGLSKTVQSIGVGEICIGTLEQSSRFLRGSSAIKKVAKQWRVKPNPC
jgi:predicted dinucleotide-binding enzyme